MIETVKDLGDSVTLDQNVKLKKGLGDELFGLLDSLFDSSTEEEANERIEAFVAAAKRSPFKIIKMRKILTKDQKKIIFDFLGD